MTENPHTDAERTSLAWSRTLIAFATVLGLLAVRGAVLEVQTWLIAPLLVICVVLLLANGLVTTRSLRRAKADIDAGARRIRPMSLLAAASAVTALAAFSLLLLPFGSLRP